MRFPRPVGARRSRAAGPRIIQDRLRAPPSAQREIVLYAGKILGYLPQSARDFGVERAPTRIDSDRMSHLLADPLRAIVLAAVGIWIHRRPEGRQGAHGRALQQEPFDQRARLDQ